MYSSANVGKNMFDLTLSKEGIDLFISKRGTKPIWSVCLAPVLVDILEKWMPQLPAYEFSFRDKSVSLLVITARALLHWSSRRVCQLPSSLLKYGHASYIRPNSQFPFLFGCVCRGPDFEHDSCTWLNGWNDDSDLVCIQAIIQSKEEVAHEIQLPTRLKSLGF